MLADGRTVPQDEVVRTDICVIGAGPAGIAVSRELTKAGLEVLLLERGPDQREGPPVPADSATNVGIPYDVNRALLSGVGGATHRWHLDTPLGSGFGRIRELDDVDFDVRSWVARSGWPISKDHLRPFYPRARSLFSSAWPSDTPESEWDSEFKNDSFANETVETRIFHFVNSGVFAGELRHELEISQNVLLLSNSAVTEICCDESPRAVSSVKVMTSPSHTYTVVARAYVLACGGVESPRLLMASRSRHSNGLGNGYDLVGRFFMEHPHYPSGYVVPKNRVVFSDTQKYAVFMHGDIPAQRKYGLKDDLIEAEQLTRCVFRLEAKPFSEKLGAVGYSEASTRSLQAVRRVHSDVVTRRWSSDLIRDVKIVGRAPHHVGRYVLHRAAVRAGRKLGLTRYTESQVFRIRAMAEQVPNPDSRIALVERRDEFGVPMAALDWRLTEQDMASMRRTQQLFGRALLSDGHRLVESYLEDRELPPNLRGGDHHMGTTRMADSPRQGVVDRDCRVHGVDNLFVAGSSVFPTAGYANPTLTLLALAIRLADFIVLRTRSRVDIDSSSDP